jgi:L-ascorbate metabolism protein UlaG (beta-lactamase superfamily)
MAFGSFLLLPVCGFAQEEFQMDTIKTSGGDLVITFIGHGTLMFSFDGKTIHVDPWTRFTDYKNEPKADVILVTHEHADHFDRKAIGTLKKVDTALIVNGACYQKAGEGIVMKNGDVTTAAGFRVEAVPAYNIRHTRDDNTPYHPKGNGNGYIITFGDKKVYVAGDTENTAEMKALRGIDIAFLPMNLPYTMTPEMVADAARAFRPKILYPYHFGDTDTSRLVELVKGEEDIEVRIRKMP